MTASSDTLPAADRRRAASLPLAVLDDAHAAPGGVQGVLAALVTGIFELLAGSGVMPEQARAFLNLVLLDAEADGDD